MNIIFNVNSIAMNANFSESEMKFFQRIFHDEPGVIHELIQRKPESNQIGEVKYLALMHPFRSNLSKEEDDIYMKYLIKFALAPHEGIFSSSIDVGPNDTYIINLLTSRKSGAFSTEYETFTFTATDKEMHVKVTPNLDFRGNPKTGLNAEFSVEFL